MENFYFIKLINSIIIGYLCGCFQTSYLISQIKGSFDIRSKGSGNAGASNVATILGYQYGMLTALIDIIKAYIAVILVNNLYQGVEFQYFAGIFAIIGHIYPFFLNFQGGKGIASYIGMLLALDINLIIYEFDLGNLGFVYIVILILITIITDFVSVGSIFMYVSLPLYILYLYLQNPIEIPFIIFFITCLLAVVGIKKHLINIERIRNGDEIGLRSSIKGKHREA